MTVLWWALGVVCAVVLLTLLTAFICFNMAFFTSRRKEKNAPEFDIPPGRIYEPFREQMIDWMKEAKALPCREYWIASFDG